MENCNYEATPYLQVCRLVAYNGSKSVQNAIRCLFSGRSLAASQRTCKLHDRTTKVQGSQWLTPSYLVDMLVPLSTNPALRRNRSADKGDLTIPRVKSTSYDSRNFIIAGQTLWNTAVWRSERHHSSTVPVFRNRIKTFLFRAIYKTRAPIN